jgi:hypothetical protein
VPVENNNIITGYIAVAAKFNVENLGAAEFPDFLESNKAALGSVVDLKLVRYLNFMMANYFRSVEIFFLQKNSVNKSSKFNYHPMVMAGQIYHYMEKIT